MSINFRNTFFQYFTFYKYYSTMKVNYFISIYNIVILLCIYLINFSFCRGGLDRFKPF